MKKQLFLIFTTTSLLFFCTSPSSEVSQNFKCKKMDFNNLKTSKDFKNTFSIKLPKTWKTNLFYDDLQSSIYTADTTKQLTKTLLLDITLVDTPINFDTHFKLKHEQDNLAKKYIQISSKETTFINKPSYYSIAKGKKGKYEYQICHFFIKITSQSFILAKVEVYGNSLIDERMCQAFALLENIKITR